MNRSFRLIAISLLSVILMLFPLQAFAQLDLKPPPENLKVALQPDSPLQISINKMWVDPKYGQSLGYSVKNTGTGSIIGFVVDGMPGATQRAIPLEVPLEPGATRSIPITIAPQKELTGEYLAKIDFVLRQDGSTWGTRSTGDADYVVNFFEGLKTVIADSKSLVAEADDANLTKLIKSPPPIPESGGDMTKWTRSQEGFSRGYGVGLISFRESLKVRGDIQGIPGRIADLERSLAPQSSGANEPKRIRMGDYIHEPPIKILEISIGKQKVSLDQNMAARPDWLKGLKFKIENASGETINHISIALDFPETAATGNMMRWSMTYGPYPLPYNGPNKRANETPLAPGALLDLEVEFESLKKFLSSSQGMDALTQVRIIVDSIYYDDGTAWMLGQIMKQDPENPRRWTPVKPN